MMMKSLFAVLGIALLLGGTLAAQATANIPMSVVTDDNEAILLYNIDFTGSTTEQTITVTGTSTGDTLRVAVLSLDNMFYDPTLNPYAEETGTPFNVQITTPDSFDGVHQVVVVMSTESGAPGDFSTFSGEIEVTGVGTNAITYVDGILIPYDLDQVRSVYDRALLFETEDMDAGTNIQRFEVDFGTTAVEADILFIVEGDGFDTAGITLYEIDEFGARDQLVNFQPTGDEVDEGDVISTSSRTGRVRFEVEVETLAGAEFHWIAIFSSNVEVVDISRHEIQFGTTFSGDTNRIHRFRIDHGVTPRAAHIRVWASHHSGSDDIDVFLIELDTLAEEGVMVQTALDLSPSGEEQFKHITEEYTGIREYVVVFEHDDGDAAGTSIVNASISALLMSPGNITSAGAVSDSSPPGRLRVFFDRVAFFDDGGQEDGEYSRRFRVDVGPTQNLEFGVLLAAGGVDYVEFHVIDGDGIETLIQRIDATSGSIPEGTHLLDAGVQEGRVTIQVSWEVSDDPNGIFWAAFFPSSMNVSTISSSSSSDSGCSSSESTSWLLLALLAALGTLALTRTLRPVKA
jgi:hypothetical protein